MAWADVSGQRETLAVSEGEDHSFDWKSRVVFENGGRVAVR